MIRFFLFFIEQLEEEDIFTAVLITVALSTMFALLFWGKVAAVENAGTKEGSIIWGGRWNEDVGGEEGGLPALEEESLSEDNRKSILCFIPVSIIFLFCYVPILVEKVPLRYVQKRHQLGCSKALWYGAVSTCHHQQFDT